MQTCNHIGTRERLLSLMNCMTYSRVHKSPPPLFSKILKKQDPYQDLQTAKIFSVLLHTPVFLTLQGILKITYSRVHKSSDSFFSKILEKPSIVQKKMIPHIKGLDFSQRWSKKKFKMADLENSKWPPQKNLVFQLRQFSIFFHENFMDWSLG